MKNKKMDNKNFINPSETENILFRELNKKGLFPERQYQIDKMHVDFAFPKEKVVIEIDGKHHLVEEEKIRDGNRDEMLMNFGWKVRRYTANETYANPSLVAYKISKFVERNNPDKDLTIPKWFIFGGAFTIVLFVLWYIFLKWLRG